jgi:hypothetical protein
VIFLGFISSKSVNIDDFEGKGVDVLDLHASTSSECVQMEQGVGVRPSLSFRQKVRNRHLERNGWNKEVSFLALFSSKSATAKSSKARWIISNRKDEFGNTWLTAF